MKQIVTNSPENVELILEANGYRRIISDKLSEFLFNNEIEPTSFPMEGLWFFGEEKFGKEFYSLSWEENLFFFKEESEEKINLFIEGLVAEIN